MRCRTIVDQALPVSTSLARTLRNGVAISTWTASFNGGTAYDVMYDIVTPNFKKKVAKGEIINNPMVRLSCYNEWVDTKVYVCGTCSDGFYEVKHYYRSPPKYTSVRLSTVNPLSVTGEDEYDNERSETIASAWSKVDMSEIQILATLGELPETLKWIASILYRVRKLLAAFVSKKALLKTVMSMGKRLRKQKRRDGWDTSVDGISDLWLELRYAVRPLFFEMESALKALHTSIEQNVRYTARTTKRESVTGSTTGNANVAKFMLSYSESFTSSHTYRGGVMYGLDRVYENFLSTWGVLSPIEAAWELIPFSFILDWFANIGDVISAHVIGPGINPKASWIVETHTDIGQRTPISVAYIPGTDKDCMFNTVRFDGAIGYTKRSLTWKRRLPSPAIPNFPVISVNLDMAKILDLSAIVRSFVRRV